MEESRTVREKQRHDEGGPGVRKSLVGMVLYTNPAGHWDRLVTALSSGEGNPSLVDARIPSKQGQGVPPPTLIGVLLSPPLLLGFS